MTILQKKQPVKYNFGELGRCLVSSTFRVMSDNVPRIPEVWLLHSYSLRFWENAVVCKVSS
jgi:hypothetical protein